MYQKFAKTYNKSCHYGISPTIPGFKVAVTISEMIGTISPHKVITLGASQSGKQLLERNSQNGLKI
jgi:hypothetical protein